jgi:hypothetical protein
VRVFLILALEGERNHRNYKKLCLDQPDPHRVSESEARVQIVEERNDQEQPPGDQSRWALTEIRHSHMP